MDVELLEVRDFLAKHLPFMTLPEAALNSLLTHIEVRYVRRQQDVFTAKHANDYFVLIRSGALEITGSYDELVARLAEGDVLGYRSGKDVLHDASLQRVKAIEDSLLYQLPARQLDRVIAEYPEFARFFMSSGGDRLRAALGGISEESNAPVSLMHLRVGDLIARPPVTVPPDTSIRDAAKVMSTARIASILVVEQERLLGIVTDRDLRNRVLSEGMDHNQPIHRVMTKDPQVLSADSFAFEALLIMARHTIHHLPIVDHGQLIGLVSATDLHERHTSSAVYLASDISKQDTLYGLQVLSKNVPQLLRHLASANASAQSATQIISSVTDSITLRLLQLAQQKLGDPPVAYAWVAAGSQARNEQILHSDQDNCLVLSDDYDESLHGDYFRSLAQYVCDGLNACGYVYCPGDVMAKNPQWRQPLRQWKKYFSEWVDAPEPKALMLSCVFFDMRCVSGDVELFDDLKRFVLAKVEGQRMFFAYMVGNALTHQPPLGFFRNFVLIRSGDHKDTFDLKHTGVVPIVDLARLYALSAGSEVVNTHERLLAAQSSKEVTEASARELIDALEFVAKLRIQHQARQLSYDIKPDNFLDPGVLSKFERNHLKDAFSIVRDLQKVLAQRYSVSH